MLWIAFKIVSLSTIRNSILRFQCSCWSCELLSKLYLYLLFATRFQCTIRVAKLWIAFKIVSLSTIRNCTTKRKLLPVVVNCFQNCIFIYYSQQLLHHLIVQVRCELLSKLYLYLLFATNPVKEKVNWQLWIAFKIVSLSTIRNSSRTHYNVNRVVNCFQNCIFIYYSQQLNGKPTYFVVVNCFQNCIFIYYSQQVAPVNEPPAVVNCFQNCIFIYYSQRWKMFSRMVTVVNCFQNCIFIYYSQLITSY